MTDLPELDLHAHVDPRISGRDLLDLDAVVFAVTRSLDEAELALKRDDALTAWGIGCHPGLVKAHKAFDHRRFADLVAHSGYVSEVGLDGRSRVPMETQEGTFQAVLSVLAHTPRITSIHSFEAAEEVVAALEGQPIKGAILHWWLGNVEQTRRAVGLGCFFSINASSVRRQDLLDEIPLDRVLTETDHPFGDRFGGEPRPGRVDDVEAWLARHYRVERTELRRVLWRNLARLADETGCRDLLPAGVQDLVAAV